MTTMTLEGHLRPPVSVDLCLPCQVIWFDTHEDLQLSPGATLELFRVMGEQVGKGRPPLQLVTRCPRCGMRLLPTHDLQRSTRFEYWRCGQGHGRLITFYDFLREKDFVHPLSPQQLDELRKNIQSVNCYNCGAPIDLMKGSTCAHCGSPLSILDVNQPERLIAQLQRADKRGRPADPGAPQDAPAETKPAGGSSD